MRDDWEQLRHAFQSKAATTKTVRKALLDAHGVQFSVLNELPGWFPIRQSPIDFMHNFYGMDYLIFQSSCRDTNSCQ